MKILKRSVLALMLGSVVITQTGCFGEFALVKKVYNWNDGVSDNKFVKSLVFWVLNIIPIYGIAGLLDAVIFNLIEFWSGSNPIAMNEGDYEMQLVTVKGEEYKIEATKDTFTTTQLTGEKAGEVRVLKFDRTINTWKYSDSDAKDVAVLKILDQNAEQIRIYTADGPKDFDGSDLAANPLVAGHLEEDALMAAK